ncbi:MAG: isopropylmalate isomerase [Pseudomonadota bacterium]
MTDKTPKDSDTPENKKTSSLAVGAAAIGSAAVAAALLYAGKRFRKKPEDSAIGADQAKAPPSGEPPQTD